MTNYNIVSGYSADKTGATDVSTPFTNFNTDAKDDGVLVNLTLDPGTYSFSGVVGVGVRWAKDIQQLFVSGVGATINDNNGTGRGFFLGGRGQLPDNAHSARVATVLAGATSVQIVDDITKAALFVVGRYLMISGGDQQGFGGPSNPWLWERVQITASSSVTGIVSFTPELGNEYKSTWPSYVTGGPITLDLGGPATIYALDPSWGCEHGYGGFTIEQKDVLTDAVGKSITFRGVTVLVNAGARGLYPSQSDDWTAINVTQVAGTVEFDKQVGNATYIGCRLHNGEFQSAGSFKKAVFDRTVFDGFLNGTPSVLVVRNQCVIPSLTLGAEFYGATDSVILVDSEIPDISANPVTEGNIELNWTMVGGVLSQPKVTPPGWGIPGKNCVFGVANYKWAVPFVVEDIWEAGGDIFVSTSLSGGFPDLPIGSNGLQIRVHPAPQFTCLDCTGSPETVALSNHPPGRPYGEYHRRTYDGTLRQYPLADVWGVLVSVKVNVITPYTGVGALTINLDNGGINVLAPNGSTSTISMVVNTKVAGSRIATPVSVTGAQAGDTLPSAPGLIQIVQGVAPRFSRDISGEDPGTWPEIEIELVTNQGISTSRGMICNFS